MIQMIVLSQIKWQTKESHISAVCKKLKAKQTSNERGTFLGKNRETGKKTFPDQICNIVAFHLLVKKL